MTERWLVVRRGTEPFAVGDEVTVVPVPEEFVAPEAGIYEFGGAPWPLPDGTRN
jgi:hypothetical protein